MIPGRRAGYGADHDAFRASVRRFLAVEVAPNLDRWRQSDGISRDVVVAAGAAGFLGTTVPEEFGGAGTDDATFLAVLIEETVAVGATGLALLLALQAGVTIPFLLEHGSAADIRRWLPGLCDGTLIGVPAPQRLSGVACARIADALLVPQGSGRIAVVPVDHEQVTVTPITGNLAGADAACADVRVDIGSVNALPGASAVDRDLDMWFAVLALAGAHTAFDLALDYVAGRKVFGRPLAEFENTRLRLAELAAELRCATVFVDSCVAARSTHSLDATDAAAARLVAEQLRGRAVDQSLQFHGGYGYMREYPIAHAFADARFLQLTALGYGDPRRTAV